MSDAAPTPIDESTAAGRRRYPRYQLSVPFDVTVFRPGAVARLSGRAQDIGEGGLRGVISGTALTGERVELVIQLPNSLQPLTMPAMVRHEGDLHCGFEFLSLGDAQREELQCLGDDAELQAGIINGVESEPSIAPVARSGTVLCATCGYEFPEDAPICVMCGTSQSTPEPLEEIVIERRKPGKLIRPSIWATSMSASAAYYKSRGPRGTLLDSVVAVVFLVTLSVGLWQWLNSPFDRNPQSSSVTIALENVLLRPVSGMLLGSAPEIGGRSSSSTFSRWKSKSLLKVETQRIIGYTAPVRQKEAVGMSGSTAAGNGRRAERERAAAESSAAAREEPSRPSLASAATAAAANMGREQSGTANAPEPSSPTAIDLENMLLQKVLPVYPVRARRDGLQGQVVLQAVIGKDGSIAQLRPLQGPQELTAAAIDAVQHWRFRPYQMNGKPVEVETDIRLNFQLPKK